MVISVTDCNDRASPQASCKVGYGGSPIHDLCSPRVEYLVHPSTGDKGTDEGTVPPLAWTAWRAVLMNEAFQAVGADQRCVPCNHPKRPLSWRTAAIHPKACSSTSPELATQPPQGTPPDTSERRHITQRNNPNEDVSNYSSRYSRARSRTWLAKRQVSIYDVTDSPRSL